MFNRVVVSELENEIYFQNHHFQSLTSYELNIVSKLNV